jgi:hypothetical protein
MKTIRIDDSLPTFKILKFIDSESIDEVIKYAKDKNLYHRQVNAWQRSCLKQIKARLDREGLSHETIRPE